MAAIKIDMVKLPNGVDLSRFCGVNETLYRVKTKQKHHRFSGCTPTSLKWIKKTHGEILRGKNYTYPVR